MPVELIPGGSEPRDVLRTLRATLDGAGPAISLGGAIERSDAIERGGAADATPRTAPAGTAVVVTTSGSTGVPKSVVLSRSALIASATATAERIGAGRWLLTLPPTYVAGLQVLVRGLLAGHEPAVLAGSFSPAAFTAVTASMRSSIGGVRVPTFTSLVPAQLADLVAAAAEDAGVREALRSYDAILVGGQALPGALAARAADAGARVVRTYGSTETSGGCVYDGSPLPGVGVRIAGGEVQLTGPMLADGYLGDPHLTAEAFVEDDGRRWYRTGDAGTFDERMLRITGRRDNVIVSGGINVSLDRVEAAVRDVDVPGAALHGAVVVPVADDRWGEASVIVVDRAAVAPDQAGAALAAARALVAERVGKPARPARFVVVDVIPTLASGKPDRSALRRHPAVRDEG
ncbi:AMP-binding protein [Microbacterium radiodurans]|uniref:AMP-binding protein n=1 Tax=Microbacterium radiodurans TaxID=661398 RepID=A0A5J5IYM0_9MICO|nr:AMP-binding protein [Microbacterium radiodurans]KAA9089832.1 AMP-binding protein [Microbacterium radiodurans]